MRPRAQARARLRPRTPAWMKKGLTLLLVRDRASPLGSQPHPPPSWVPTGAGGKLRFSAQPGEFPFQALLPLGRWKLLSLGEFPLTCGHTEIV